jgi:very-short-patch-repair endonuclease
VYRGVYVVGRPELSRRGRWIAAVLACGEAVALSHESAAALWEIRDQERNIEVSILRAAHLRRPGILVHRRGRLSPGAMVHHEGIPVTSPALTLIDLAARIRERELETAINEADKRDRIDPETLRLSLPQFEGIRGVGRLRRLLDRQTFILTDSDLERLFLRIVRRVRLPMPLTQQRVNGFRVDFHWPELGLVIETDGLRYHRTPSQQAKDRRRDQTHAAAGISSLRFTHAQVAFQPEYVERVLGAVTRRLAA